MSLNYVLPNGVTMGFGNEAERDAYLNSSAGAGAQTQQSAMAANPGQSMEQIKNQNHAAHYGVGGAGFGQALLGSERDWGANQDKNQWIAQQTGYGGDFGGGNFNAWASQNGVNGGQLEQAWNQRQQAAGPAGGFSFQPYGQSGFGQQTQTMGFGQAPNSWANLPGMQGLLSGFGQQAMGGPSSSNGWQGPSDGAANTGHNMLWSW